MAGDWTNYRLGEIGKVVTGRTPPGTEQCYFGEEIPFLTPTDMDGRRRVGLTGRMLSPEGRMKLTNVIVPHGIAVSCIGWQMGKAILVDKPVITNQQINSLIPDRTKADDIFLYYALSARRDNIFRLGAGGSRTPILNKTGFEAFTIQLPSLSEQRNIARVLGSLDDKIELNREMNETLEGIARALFKSWFVDFDPVRKRVDGLDPCLPSHIAALFPNCFEDSDLGEIPKGWRAARLGEILTVLETGGRPKGGVRDIVEGVPSVGAESIVGLGIFDYGKTKYVSNTFFEAMKKGHAVDYDVLLYKDGGRPGEFEPHATLVANGFPFDEFCINEHVYRVRCDPALPQSYLFFWMTSDAAMAEMRIRGTGVAIPGLNSTAVRALSILVPSFDVLRAFERVVAPLIERVFFNCNESRSLSVLRDRLLPKLISGEVRTVTAEETFLR